MAQASLPNYGGDKGWAHRVHTTFEVFWIRSAKTKSRLMNLPEWHSNISETGCTRRLLYVMCPGDLDAKTNAEQHMGESQPILAWLY